MKWDEDTRDRFVLLCLLSVGLFPTGGAQSVFGSKYHMERLVRLEKNILSELKIYASKLETAFNKIKSYIKEATQVFEECDDEEECNEKEKEKILGNPIHNYHLLKRVTVLLKEIQAYTEEVESEAVLNTLKKKMMKKKRIPTNQDMELSAKSLNNLVEVYQLQAQDLANGLLDGVETGTSLNEQDLFYLGTQASNQKKHQVAVNYLKQALLMFQQQNTSSDNQIYQEVEHLLKIEQGLAGHAREFEFVPGEVPPKTNDESKMTTEQDKANYEALCRGQSLLPESVSKHLTCYYSTRNQAYFYLQPVAVEEVYPAPHQILVFHHVISPSECDQVSGIAEAGLRQSEVGEESQLSDIRQSQSYWIEDNQHEVVDKLSLRMNLLTGLQTSALFDKYYSGREEEYEYLQVGSYGPGGHYGLHQDPLYVHKDDKFIAMSLDAEESYPTGDRMSTLMLYLSDVRLGGRTAFPRLGVSVAPERGSAVLWHNIQPDGWSDMMMLHGGCPVILGRKSVANKWILELANMFHRKCESKPNKHQYNMF